MSEFKVGDRVYCPLYSERIFTLENHGVGQWFLVFKKRPSIAINRHGIAYGSSHACVFHATPENYELLSKLYPNVEFEKPKAVGSDLTRQKLESGETNILCWVSDVSDHIATQDKRIQVVISEGTNGCFNDDARENWLFAVPVPRNYYAMNDSDE